MSHTTTPNYGFPIPDRGELDWDVPLNQAINQIDSAIANVQSGVNAPAVLSLVQSGTSLKFTGDINLVAGPGATLNFRAASNTIEISGIGSPGGQQEAVNNLGILGDSTVLTDEVKLTAGPLISLNRKSSANSIEISGLSFQAVTGLVNEFGSATLTNNIKLVASPGATLNFRSSTNIIEISGIGTAGGIPEAVSTLGILGDGIVLTDDVKLISGPHISIARDNINNAFQFSGTNLFEYLKFNYNGLIEVAEKVDGPYVMNREGDIRAVRGYRQAAGTSGTSIVDVLINSSSAFNDTNNKLMFVSTSGNNLKQQASTISTVSFKPGDDISVNFDQVESGTPEDLAVSVEIQFK